MIFLLSPATILAGLFVNTHSVVINVLCHLQNSVNKNLLQQRKCDVSFISANKRLNNENRNDHKIIWRKDTTHRSTAHMCGVFSQNNFMIVPIFVVQRFVCWNKTTRHNFPVAIKKIESVMFVALNKYIVTRITVTYMKFTQ